MNTVKGKLKGVESFINGLWIPILKTGLGCMQRQTVCRFTLIVYASTYAFKISTQYNIT